MYFSRRNAALAEQADLIVQDTVGGFRRNAIGSPIDIVAIKVVSEGDKILQSYFNPVDL